MSTRKTGTPEQARALNGCDHDRKMVTWPSADEIDGAKTPAGGWTRETLAQWGRAVAAAQGLAAGTYCA